MYSPPLDEFVKLAAQGNLIPVTRRILADFETPLSAYLKIRGHGESFLFESVDGGEHIGRYSFVGCNPRAVIRQLGNVVEVIENGRIIESFAVGKNARDGLEIVERVMKKYRVVALPNLPRFTGGAVGFIGYEFIHDIEPVVPPPPVDELKTPVIYFLIADQLLIFDRVAQTITILVNAVLDGAESPAEAYENAASEIDRIVSLLEQPSQYKAVAVVNEIPPVQFVSNQSKEKFFANVETARKYIHRGDIIQVVGSQRFSAPVKAAPLDIYRAVRSINPSPYHVFARTGRLFARRRLARNPRALRRGQGGDSPHCRNPPAREERRGGFGVGKGIARRSQGTRRARHARGPRPQRHRPRLRFRQRVR